MVTLLAKEYGADVGIKAKFIPTPRRVALELGHANVCEVIDRIDKKCAHFRSHCNAEAKFQCPRCKSVRYCSKEHQEADWSVHRPNCNSIRQYRKAQQVAQNPTVLKSTNSKKKKSKKKKSSRRK